MSTTQSKSEFDVEIEWLFKAQAARRQLSSAPSQVPSDVTHPSSLPYGVSSTADRMMNELTILPIQSHYTPFTGLPPTITCLTQRLQPRCINTLPDQPRACPSVPKLAPSEMQASPNGRLGLYAPSTRPCTSSVKIMSLDDIETSLDSVRKSATPLSPSVPVPSKRMTQVRLERPEDKAKQEAKAKEVDGIRTDLVLTRKLPVPSPRPSVLAARASENTDTCVYPQEFKDPEVGPNVKTGREKRR
ncbi:hypothetical protein EVJ58_g4858 [Rhodofomes roseus]|uniref:Uncharacterized protein n=1 Tax=Rhodofomes roseus TaxID=34475 RepID=A0A4Y9YEB5_9APHY|nr:hypothetical protein EVJ58_g4858 [Rhodofomes roseus]